MSRIGFRDRECEVDCNIRMENTKMVLRNNVGKNKMIEIGGVFDGEFLHALAEDAGLLDGSSMPEVFGDIYAKIPGRDEKERKSVLKSVLGFLVDWGVGKSFDESLKLRGCDEIAIGFIKRCSREYMKLYEQADILRMGQIVPKVMDAAVDLAVNGDVEPIFSREGELLGEKKRRNVRAQELILKAGDKRFAEDKGGAVNSGGVVYNIAVLPSVSLPEPGAVANKMSVEIEDKKEEEVIECNGVHINLGLVDSLPTDI